MGKTHEEWLRQADYDMDTAELMHKHGRNFYAVFMCHLSVEKAIKGLYQRRVDKVPPKIHNLMFLMNKIGIKPPGGIDILFVRLNEAQIATRYPEELAALHRQYTKEATGEIVDKAKQVLEWIKKQF